MLTAGQVSNWLYPDCVWFECVLVTEKECVLECSVQEAHTPHTNFGWATWKMKQITLYMATHNGYTLYRTKGAGLQQCHKIDVQHANDQRMLFKMQNYYQLTGLHDISHPNHIHTYSYIAVFLDKFFGQVQISKPECKPAQLAVFSLRH